MPHSIYRWSLNIVTAGILVALLLVFTGHRMLSADLLPDISAAQWQSLKTVFVSIFLEALPFILLGVLVSSFMNLYISEERMRRFIPKNPLLGVVYACLLGILLPVCECCMIPIVRRLISKGMPVYIGITYILAAPIINPVTFAATYMAFRLNTDMVYFRMGLAFAVSAIVGLVLYHRVRTSPLKFAAASLEAGESAAGLSGRPHDRYSQGPIHSDSALRHGAHEHVSGSHHQAHMHDHHIHRYGHAHDHDHDHSYASGGKFLSVFTHAADEFFEMGKFLMLGAFLTALIQTFVSRDDLVSLSGGDLGAHALMMAFAFLISLCSTSDAFIAASFNGVFPKGALLAFLVFGPMVDFKNTLMMLAVFRSRFVFGLIVLITAVVLILSIVAGQLWPNP